MSKKPGQLSFHYEERPDKPTVSVSGAHGGLSGDGRTVVAHVYSEWGMLPSLEQVPIDEAGRPGKRTLIKRGDVNREVQATLVMTPEAAMEFGKWLVTRARQAYDQRDRATRPDVEVIEGGEPGDGA